MDSAVSIKSKERVQEHGEVFTPDSIVNDMLDLTDKELKGIDSDGNILELHGEDEIKKYIDTTYLEPSCGNGNFLIRILDRKLEGVQKLEVSDQELWLLHAVASMYGVDIQKDNVDESKERLLRLIKTGEVSVLDLESRETQPWHFKAINLSPELERVVKFILDNNIKHGNCLTGMQWDRMQETSEPMVFTEYLWDGTSVSCKGHTLEDIAADADNDMYNNNGKKVPYMQIQSLNFNYSNTIEMGDDGYGEDAF